MSALPVSFVGGIRFGFNLRSLLGLQPKGLAVFLEFDKPLEPDGIQDYIGYLQVQFLPTAGTCFLGSGTVDFDQRTLIFVGKDDLAHFDGSIDPTAPEIKGTIRIKNVRDTHTITFRPVPEEAT
jgi:hypothetical protein